MHLLNEKAPLQAPPRDRKEIAVAGKVAGLVLHQGGANMPGRKVR
jgi:hypothetical protein